MDEPESFELGFDMLAVASESDAMKELQSKSDFAGVCEETGGFAGGVILVYGTSTAAGRVGEGVEGICTAGSVEWMTLFMLIEVVPALGPMAERFMTVTYPTNMRSIAAERAAKYLCLETQFIV